MSLNMFMEEMSKVHTVQWDIAEEERQSDILLHGIMVIVFWIMHCWELDQSFVSFDLLVMSTS